MITYEQARKNILRHTKTLPAEKALITDVIGRILKEDVYSGLVMPPFDKAAMDGYAVNGLDVKNAPVKLKCAGVIQAGATFLKRIRRGECVKIMTGAALPKNSDTVIMVENSRLSGKKVEILQPARRGENICFKGEDLKPGQKVFNRGTKISPSHVAMLATVGKKFVKVISRPRVAILNTGGEIVPAGRRLGRNQIYNSNGPMLETLLKSDNLLPCNLGIAKDKIRPLELAIKKGLRRDVLLISGGVSMGDYDLIPETLAGLGVKKIFHKVNIKPGKPLFFGKKGKTLIFGIPGNPISNFSSYLLFVRPALYKMMGYLFCGPDFREGTVTRGFYSKSGRKHFVLANIAKKGSRYLLSPVTSHGSADILALSKADGFMVVDEKSSFVNKGAKLQFITWKTI